MKLHTPLTILLLCVTPLLAQQPGPNPKAPPETAQFSFVIGEWNVHIHFQTRDSSWTDYHATWRNSWLAGGYVVHQDWDGTILPYQQHNKGGGNFIDTARSYGSEPLLGQW